MAERAFPLTFRAEVLKPLVENLRRGESVSLVGVASVGKGNLMRQLARRPIREFYFQTDASHFLLVTVDCNFLREYADAAVYAEILSALSKAVVELDARGAVIQPQLIRWAHDALKPEGAIYAQPNLRAALDKLLAVAEQRLVLLLDDCDVLFGQATPALLRGLRALRDAHKDQLMYVTLTRRELARLRPLSLDFEHFFELTPAHVIGIKPYREQDSDVMLDWMAEQQKANAHRLTDEDRHRLYLITGGHAGLLKQTYEVTQFGEHIPELGAVTQLLTPRLLRAECQKILDSLDADEIRTLTEIAFRRVTAHGIASLKGKGLVREETDGMLAVFSPLLAEYLRAYTQPQAPSPPKPRFALNKELGTLRIDRRDLYVDEFEAELVDLLLVRRPEACDDEEMLTRLRLVQPTGVTYKQLYQIIVQLQTKLNADGRSYLVRNPDTRWRLRGDEEL